MSERQDGLGQLCVAGLQGWHLRADVQESTFQFGATDVALAANEAGGVVTGGLDDLVVTERGGNIGSCIGGRGYRANDGVGGDNEAGGVYGAGQAQQQGGANQVFTGHDRGLLD
ncbi:protein of unknown function [Pseudomonas sp. JV551A1]|nr:protein of unknown function [Pseudomonas sp. JV551A1]